MREGERERECSTLSLECLSIGHYIPLQCIHVRCLHTLYVCISSLIFAYTDTSRHHIFNKSGGKEVELKEVGPRFELKCKKSCLLRVRVNHFGSPLRFSNVLPKVFHHFHANSFTPPKIIFCPLLNVIWKSSEITIIIIIYVLATTYPS